MSGIIAQNDLVCLFTCWPLYGYALKRGGVDGDLHEAKMALKDG